MLVVYSLYQVSKELEMNEIENTMFIKIGKGKTLYQVSSYEEAAMKFAIAKKKAHEMLNFKPQTVTILNADFAQIARISPNGRVWDMADNLLSESVNLYK